MNSSTPLLRLHALYLANSTALISSMQGFLAQLLAEERRSRELPTG